MKFTRAIFLCAALAALLRAPALALAEDKPAVSARAGVLIDAASGDALWELDADEPMLIASTTKIMTALVALDCLEPDETVTIDAAWTGIEGSSMYLAPGEEYTVRELLYGLLLASGNDAAVALACAAAGSEAAFADLMNARADALGCGHTHFVNPHGLDAPEHYSCARDLARIARAAIENELLRDIVSCRSAEIGGRTLTNHNKLLGACEGVFGVKTGYTEAAGRSLVTACERDGITLVCVTLSDPDDWDDHTRLYDWAFAQYETEQAVSAGSVWTVPVVGGTAETVTVSPERGVSVTRRAGETVSVALRLPAFVYASVTAGDAAGEAVVSLGGEAVETVRLIYNESVAREISASPALADRLRDIFGFGEGRLYALS